MAYQEISKAVETSDFKDATEYCRAVHAEMDALIGICRNPCGSTLGATVYVTTQPCHNCTKHLIVAGVDHVVYIEPYPKSLGDSLHSDAVSLNPKDSCISDTKIYFVPYQGAAPRRYHDLFDMDQDRKDDKGRIASLPKEKLAESPKFATKVTKRSRLETTNPVMNLISFNEVQAAFTIQDIKCGGENGAETTTIITTEKECAS